MDVGWPSTGATGGAADISREERPSPARTRSAPPRQLRSPPGRCCRPSTSAAPTGHGPTIVNEHRVVLGLTKRPAGTARRRPAATRLPSGHVTITSAMRLRSDVDCSATTTTPGGPSIPYTRAIGAALNTTANARGCRTVRRRALPPVSYTHLRAHET